jgi:class 3 adenylate cyclase
MANENDYLKNVLGPFPHEKLLTDLAKTTEMITGPSSSIGNLSSLINPSILSGSYLINSSIMSGSSLINQSIMSGSADPHTQTKLRELESEISKLKGKVSDQAQKLRQENVESTEKTEKIALLEKTLLELQEKQQLDFLLSRVNGRAQKAILESKELRTAFLNQRECRAFVMSVDIRRSTELMLKARTPEQFAAFITGLCSELVQIVKDHYGVFDKFTGDGILAFFPEFFSGSDAGAFAIRAASQCHDAFRKHYRNCRGSFSSVLNDVGLGIGIDYGSAHLVQMAGGLTVVGVPVVYACRLGGAPAGTTLLNQPAYEKVSTLSGAFFFEEASLEVKHEGSILAYSVSPSGAAVQPSTPAWDTPPSTSSGSDTTTSAAAPPAVAAARS